MLHFRNKRGEGYLPVCIVTVIIAMLLSVFLQFSASVGTVSQVRDNSQTVFDNFVISRSVDIFAAIKQGSDDNNVLDAQSFRTELSEFCTFEENDGFLYHYDNAGNEEYRISAPVLSFDEENSLKLRCSYTVYIPMFFAGQKVGTAEVPIEIKSRLTSKN